MATIPSRTASSKVDYPTRDGRPVGESDVHRDRHFDLVQVLRDLFAADPMVYVSGNLLIFYVPGDKRRHVAPDVFVVRGVPRRQRDNYLVWEEGRAPDLVIELTSPSTRKEDLVKKFELYRDVLRVPEYFLFDPRDEYLKPPLQGYRLTEGQYVRIEPVAGGRLPSAVLGLELERMGSELRLYDPASGRYLPTSQRGPPRGRGRAAAGRGRCAATGRGRERAAPCASWRNSAASGPAAGSDRDDPPAAVRTTPCGAGGSRTAPSGPIPRKATTRARSSPDRRRCAPAIPASGPRGSLPAAAPSCPPRRPARPTGRSRWTDRTRRRR